MLLLLTLVFAFAFLLLLLILLLLDSLLCFPQTLCQQLGFLPCSYVLVFRGPPIASVHPGHDPWCPLVPACCCPGAVGAAVGPCSSGARLLPAGARALVPWGPRLAAVRPVPIWCPLVPEPWCPLVPRCRGGHGWLPFIRCPPDASRCPSLGAGAFVLPLAFACTSAFA